MTENSLKIDTGTIRLAIERDGKPTGDGISFNPGDILFAEKYYRLTDRLTEKDKEYKKRAAALDENKAEDENGIPINAGERIALSGEICNEICSELDILFGEGTSNKAFGEVRNFDVLYQFFDGIKPFIQSARKDKVNKYINPAVHPKRPRHTKN